MDTDSEEFREQCADPEGFLGYLLLSLPQTDENPTVMLTCVSACALLHCRFSDEKDESPDNSDNQC